MQRPGGAQRKDEMSIHVCKCEHNGRTEFHLRYPGMTQDEAQTLADRINGGELVDADHPLRKDAERLNWLERQHLEELSMQLVVDAKHDGQYYVCGDSYKPGYGPTLRAAIDAAMLAG